MGLALLRQHVFSAHRGEILGFFGLIGAGRSELFKLIYGATKAQAGKVHLAARRAAFTSPREAIAAGVALCPEDRKDEASCLCFRCAKISSSRIAMPAKSARLFRDDKRERKQANDGVAALKGGKRLPRKNAISTLSGGNQQKVVLARWLAAGADIFLDGRADARHRCGRAQAKFTHCSIAWPKRAGRFWWRRATWPRSWASATASSSCARGGSLGRCARAAVTQDALLRLALPDARPAHAGMKGFP